MRRSFRIGPEVTGMEQRQHMETAEDRWLTRSEVAERLRVPLGAVADWASKGTGPPYARIGKFARYRLSDVIACEQGQAASRRTAEDLK
jgi:hypothetical protein